MGPDAEPVLHSRPEVAAQSSDAFDSSPALPATFERLVRAVARGELVELSKLRALLITHVGAAKETGDAPERAIGALRNLLGADAEREDRTAHRLLWQLVVSWCLDEYFGPYYGQFSETPTRTDRESPVRREVTRSD
jgi:hypothetical protein